MSIEVKNIKVNNMTDPIGINARAPEISWQVSGNGQSAYQIIAAASETELEQGVLLWDSGKVADSRTFGHRYGGSVLQSPGFVSRCVCGMQMMFPATGAGRLHLKSD